MYSYIEEETKQPDLQRQDGGLKILVLATSVMQDLQDNRSTSDIIGNRLGNDIWLFKMISSYLYNNRWLTRQNIATEKGKAWLEMISDPDLRPLK
jgi:hypothetical protein